MATIAFIGTGKIAQAFIKGLAETNWNLVAYDPSAEALELAEKLGATCEKDSISAVKKAETVIVCTKPEKVTTVLKELSGDLEEKLVISVAAGMPTQKILASLDKKIALVRAMPNTPAAVMRGITVYVPNGNVPKQQAEVCGELLSSVGESVLIDDEGLMDAVTAVSGSGPAYVFLVIEAMAKAGIMSGLPPELAMRLARATVSGSGELARLSEETADQLRINVTSPGGTTAAALEILMSDDGIQPIFDEAIKAAAKRSKELAG